MAKANKASGGATAMATAEAPIPEATRRFLGLVCPMCSGIDSVSLDLTNLDLFHCSNCADTFGPAQIRAMLLEPWERVLAWIEAAPIAPDDMIDLTK